MSENDATKKAKSNVSFKDSIKTKMITMMILTAAVPLLVAEIVSYKTSTDKAMEDAQASLEWQARYLSSKFVNILDANMNMIKSIAGNPTIN